MQETTKDKAGNTAAEDSAKTAAKNAKQDSKSGNSNKSQQENNPQENTSTDSQKNDQIRSTKPLKKFFIDALKDMYYAENAISEALPKMREAATTEELQDAFEEHEWVTKKQISRLEKVFKCIGEQAEKKECKAIKGLLEEGQEIMKSTPEGSMTRDAALIIAAQKVEHYEIATYGSLVQLALTLDEQKAARLLEDSLHEEEDTDHHLTDIAESYINFEAEEEGK